MIMFSIAEWVANFLILGIGLLFWSLFIGVSVIIVFEVIDRFTR